MGHIKLQGAERREMEIDFFISILSKEIFLDSVFLSASFLSISLFTKSLMFSLVFSPKTSILSLMALIT